MDRKIRRVRATKWVLKVLAGFALLGLLPQAALAQQESWKQKLDAITELAKKEGKLVVAGPQGRAWQTALQQFSQDYPGIKIEVTSFQGDEFWPRLQKERDVGQHLWDLRVGGINPSVWRIKGSGVFAKARDLMLLPELLDEKNWHGGFQMGFLDKDKQYFPSFCVYESKTAYVNTAFVTPADLPSIQNIVDPKWQGKIAILDPWGGSASITLALMYRHFGPDFLKKLLVDQKPVFVKDPRQATGWLASGKYPIAIGISNAALDEYQRAGIKLSMFQPPGIRIWSPGVCALMVFEKRPHPNATIVFINWLLRRDVQERLMSALKLNSRFRGVTSHMPPERTIDYDQIAEYESGQTEEYDQDMLKSAELVRSLLP